MRRIKAFLKIPFKWIRLRFLEISYKKKMKKIQKKRFEEFKKEAPKKIEIKRRPGKNLDLFAYEPDMDIIYQVLVQNGRAFVNPDHPNCWAVNYKNAERKLRKKCDKCIYIENSKGREIKFLACEFCKTENNISEIVESFKK